MKQKTVFKHSVNHLKNLLEMCDPNSKGYSNLVKISNARLHDKDTHNERTEFNKQWELIARNTVVEYFAKLALPESYTNHKKEIKDTLLKIHDAVKTKGKNDTAKPIIVYCENWSSFIRSTLNDDIVNQRIDILRKITKNERHKIITTIHTNDLPGNFTKYLQNYTQLMISPKSLDSNLELSKELKALPEDYMSDKQQVLAIHRLDFLAGLRLLSLVFEKFDLKLKKDHNLMLSLAEVFEKGLSHIALGDKKIIVLKSPKMQIEPLISEDSWAPTIRLHSETKPAYETDDTKQLYFLHGVYLPQKIWKKTTTKNITVTEIMAIKNIEQRRVVIQHTGAEIFSEHETAVPSKISPHGNQLIRLVGLLNKSNTPDLDDDMHGDVLMIKYKDPSTGREYHSFVPPTIDADDADSEKRTDPDEAMAWKFGMGKAEYYNNMRAEG